MVNEQWELTNASRHAAQSASHECFRTRYQDPHVLPQISPFSTACSLSRLRSLMPTRGYGLCLNGYDGKLAVAQLSGTVQVEKLRRTGSIPMSHVVATGSRRGR